MTTNASDKALAEILTAIHTQFPELAGRGMDSMVEFIKIDSLIGMLFSAFFAMLFLVGIVYFLTKHYMQSMDQYDAPGYAFLAIGCFLMLFITLILFLCSVAPYVATEGYIVSKILMKR